MTDSPAATDVREALHELVEWFAGLPSQTLSELECSLDDILAPARAALAAAPAHPSPDAGARGVTCGAIPDAGALREALVQQGREEVMREVFALHEDTIERYHAIGNSDTEGKQGAFSRGRCAEAKSIARAIGDVVQGKRLAALSLKEPAGG